MAALPRPDPDPEAEAAGRLYERFGGPVYRFCVARLHSREDAEDAVQSTFLRAHAALRKGVRPRAEAAWLYKIAHNVCLSRRHAGARRSRVETPRDLDGLAAAAPEGADPLALLGLEAALADMPPRPRQAILLREWQGLSYGEIADELGVSASAVESLIFRARRHLADALAGPRRKLGAILDAGSLAGLLRALLTGGGAKVAAAGAGAVAVVVAAGPVVHVLASHPAPHPHPAVRRLDVRAPVAATDGARRIALLAAARHAAHPAQTRRVSPTVPGHEPRSAAEPAPTPVAAAPAAAPAVAVAQQSPAGAAPPAAPVVVQPQAAALPHPAKRAPTETTPRTTSRHTTTRQTTTTVPPPTTTVAAVTTSPVTPPPPVTPTLTVPALTVPALTLPQVPALPTVTTPAVTTPAVTTPAVTTPAVQLPSVTVPSVTVPSVTVPSVTVPSLPAVTSAVTQVVPGLTSTVEHTVTDVAGSAGQTLTTPAVVPALP